MKFNNNFQLLGNNINIGKNVKIGDRTIIYDNVQVGDDTIIANDCIIGEPLHNYYYNDNYINPETKIGESSLIRSHAIIYAGSTFGNELQTGHRITILPDSKIGHNCSIGTLCDIQGDIEIGNYCRLHSNIHVGQKSIIKNYVFIYPFVIFTNDPTPPSDDWLGVTVDEYTQIGAGSILMPGIKIGKNCLIGAGSVVSKDFNDFSLVMGNPGRRIGDVKKIKSRKKDGFHYPWMYNFERGMPWKGIGYDEWLKKKNYGD
ncbi:MAG: hypothetical protein A2V66_07080 [Ignavibacteria bacterium RBG_13_36_8]|nr:MAG: hypothetical protein A2V66_07080 [Ignavibacteria bacterium RBG_13_36_8]